MTLQSDALVRLAAGAVLALSIGYLLHIGRPILMPLVLGLFVAYLFWTLVEWVRRAPMLGRLLPGWLAHLGALALITVLIWSLFLLVTGNIAQVERQMPAYRDNLEDLLEQASAWLGLEQVPTVDQVMRQAIAAIDLNKMIGSAVGLATALLGNMVVIFIYTLFVLMERAALVTKLEQLAPHPAASARMTNALAEISGRIGRYLVLKTFVSALVALGSWIIMRLIGIDFAEFWAVLIFVFNFIPYVGSFAAVSLPTLLSLVQFGALGPFLVTAAALTGMQVVVGNLLEPRLLGRSLNLSPIVILLSLATWSALWGLVGAFLCVPLTVIMLIIFSEFQTTRPLAILLSQDGRIDPEDDHEPRVTDQPATG